MAFCVRAKRVTDPLDDRVKTSLCCWGCRIAGCESSGSEHEADPSCLDNMVYGFIEEEDARISQPETTQDSGQEEFPDGEVLEMLRDLVNANVNVNDRLKCQLGSLVSQAVEDFSGVLSSRSVLRRAVMKRLRDTGYNAGICKSKWESSGALTAGNHEYIDVVINQGIREKRYLIEVDFAGEFEIARPTGQYSRIMQILPRVFVGRPDELKQIVRVVCEAAKKSLKARELHLPPWRKNRYMQAKWLGPYRRTLNSFPTTGKLFPLESDGFTAVKCRLVGFKAYANAVNMDLV